MEPHTSGKSNTRKKLVSNKRNESRKVMHRKSPLKCVRQPFYVTSQFADVAERVMRQS